MGLKNNRVVRYFIESKKEMKKVTWPNKQETTKYTLVVIGVSLAVAAFLGALDYLFSFGLEAIINK